MSDMPIERFAARKKSGEGCAYVCFRRPLLARSSTECFRMPLRDSSESYLGNLTPIGRSLIEAMAMVTGVTQISVRNPHDATVYFGGAFAWDGDIGPAVQSAVTAAFAKHGMQAEHNEPAVHRSHLIAELERDAAQRERQSREGSPVSSMAEDAGEGMVAVAIREIMPKIKALNVLD